MPNLLQPLSTQYEQESIALENGIGLMLQPLGGHPICTYGKVYKAS